MKCLFVYFWEKNIVYSVFQKSALQYKENYGDNKKAIILNVVTDKNKRVTSKFDETSWHSASLVCSNAVVVC